MLPDLVRPCLELGVVGDAALERDGLELGAAGRLAAAADGSPPSRCFTTSVVRFSVPTLLTPATYLPSHFTRNLKFL